MNKKDTNEKKEPIVNEEFDINGQEGAAAETADDPDSCCNAECCSDEDSDSCCSAKDSSGESDNDKGCCDDTDDRIDGLMQKIADAEQKRDEYLAMAQRIQADFENYKRRSRAAAAEAYDSAKADVAEAILPVLDNLERALSTAEDSGAQGAFIKGIEMVRRQFVDSLKRLGIEEIEALGQPFDPKLHEAVMQVDAADGQEENTVAAVLQKGYRMGDKIIRYSMVHVAK